MTTICKMRACLTSLAIAATLGLGAAAPAHASYALGFVQNETPGTVPNGDYNIDYLDYALNPAKFLAFSPMLALGTSSVLKFRAFVGDEWNQDPANYDQFSLWASADGVSIGYNLLASSAPSLGGVAVPEWGGIPGYVDVTVDLSAYAGQLTSLAFSFDPLDDVSNDYPGVRIDDIRVTNGAATLFSENFESGGAAGWQLNGLWHVTENFAYVPEPSTLSLLAVCAIGFGLSRRRRQRPTLPG